MKKIIAVSALMAALASANSMAADANLTFTGGVSTGTCVMNSADVTKTLVIPDVNAATLIAGGGGAYQTINATSTIGFSGCPQTTSKIVLNSATTTGSPFTGYIPSEVYRMLPASGTAASGVNMMLVVNGVPVSPTGSMLSNFTAANVSATGTANVPVLVGISPNSDAGNSIPAPSAGNYSSSYTLSFSYS